MADATAGLEHLFGPADLDELWTFFADPWHKKKRHHKRRIVNPDTARLVTSRLRPGGLWRLATDWDDYATGCSKYSQPSRCSSRSTLGRTVLARAGPNGR